MAGKYLALLGLYALLCQGCGILPAEMNLGPLYRHRLDGQGEVLSMDVLWPIFRYETLPEGGWDFRIRPLYRRVKEPDQDLYQYFWPLGRARIAEGERSARLFPLFTWRTHTNEKGEPDLDWSFLMPLIWGGKARGEDYFAVAPFYGRIPQFLSYDEAGWFLFPLYTWSVKGSQRTRSVLFPLFSHGWGSEQDDSWYWRFLPFYTASGKPGDFRHHALLWPLASWGRENMGGRDPRSYWLAFPLAGRKVSDSGEFSDWTALWPLFSCRREDRESVEWEGPWPLFGFKDVPSRNSTNPADKGRFKQWWLTPLYGATDSERHWARTILWPLIRLRHFEEPQSTQEHTAVLPFYWRNLVERADGSCSSLTHLWPLLSTAYDKPRQRVTHFPDPIPTRLITGAGWRENYDFLWNLFTRRQHGERASVETPANLFRYDRHEGMTTWSIPLLGHHEKGAEGKHTLRLLHLIPISWGGKDSEEPAKEGG